MKQTTPLKKSLIVKTSPIAKKENIVFWKDYRVTVLQDRLFRIEKSPNGIFRDDATQSVWFRDLEKQDFTVEKTDEEIVIATNKVKLILKEKREDCRIVVDGTKKKIQNAKNLKGTYRTLDCCDGDVFYPKLYEKEGMSVSEKLKLKDGVCSLTGVAVFDDSPSLTLNERGLIDQRGNGSDEYVFAYGDDYREAVKALFAITGFPPQIPRFAFGNWWSRYRAYDEREYIQLMNRFEENDLPLTVATVDMDWHYSNHVDETFSITKQGKNTPFYGGANGWTGYSWNKELFPDYRSFLKKLHDKNLRVTLNLHPADGVRWWEDCYGEMAKAMGVDEKSERKIPFDMTDNKFVNAYFDVIHKPYEKDGVDFWWIDWQQGEDSEIEGLDPLWLLNHYHFLDNGESGQTPLILSRYAGIGSHRYPLGFSGDSFITWKTLKYLTYFTATASNVGYTWWSHDIGGHHFGENDGELYLRHVQYGVFSPINRLHCSNAETMTKEPWAYENGRGKIAVDFLRLRHALIPFLYSLSHETFKKGRALVEPLYYEWKSKEAYEYKNQYLFGGLLVAPVTTPLLNDGFSRTKVWIPEGEWTDIFTGEVYVAPEGGRETTLLRRLESIPVLAKSGTVLPLSKDEGNSSKNPVKLQVEVFNGDGEFILFEDGKEDGKLGEVNTTFKLKRENGKQILTVFSRGDLEIIPDNRLIRVLFKNLKRGKVSLFINGKKVENEELISDFIGAEFSYDPKDEYRVEVEFNEKTELERTLETAFDALLKAEDTNQSKSALSLKLKGVKTLEEYIGAVEGSGLRKVNKLKLLETVIR